MSQRAADAIVDLADVDMQLRGVLMGPLRKCPLGQAPVEVRAVLADLQRLLLEEPRYRAEFVVSGGVPMAALRVEHPGINPVLVTVSLP